MRLRNVFANIEGEGDVASEEGRASRIRRTLSKGVLSSWSKGEALDDGLPDLDGVSREVNRRVSRDLVRRSKEGTCDNS